MVDAHWFRQGRNRDGSVGMGRTDLVVDDIMYVWVAEKFRDQQV